jgi:hypothetical protein
VYGEECYCFCGWVVVARGRKNVVDVSLFYAKHILYSNCIT